MLSPHGNKMRVSQATGRRAYVLRIHRGDTSMILVIVCAVVALLLFGMMAALFVGPQRTVRPPMVRIPPTNTGMTTTSASSSVGTTPTPASATTASSPASSAPAGQAAPATPQPAPSSGNGAAAPMIPPIGESNGAAVQYQGRVRDKLKHLGMTTPGAHGGANAGTADPSAPAGATTEQPE